jgi:hypothetical protein
VSIEKFDKRRVHALHQELKPIAAVKRTHVYELLAAACGYRSWTAMNKPTAVVRPPSKKLLLWRCTRMQYPTTVADCVWAALHH